MRIIKKLKRTVRYIDTLAFGARFMSYLGVKICCAMFAASLFIMIYAGGYSVYTYYSYRLAFELVSVGSVSFLISILASVCIEDSARRR